MRVQFLYRLLSKQGIAAVVLAASFGVQSGCSSSDPELPSTSYGTITTWAGEAGRAAFDGDGKSIKDSWLYYPVDLTFTSTGCYVLDWNNHRLRLITPQNTFQTVVGTHLLGDGDSLQADRTAPGALGTDIDLNHPTDVVELPNGRLLLSCWHNHKIREYDPATGLAFVRIGDANGYDGDGGPARDALLDFPTQTVVGADGSLYILDQRNMCVRKVDPNGVISTVVGTGMPGFNGDGRDPATAQLNFPTGNNPEIAGALALDGQGRLYVADELNHRIRRVDFDKNVIETVAGNGVAGFGGDHGDARAASLNTPGDIEFGPDGRLYIADERNHRVRAVDLVTGIIVTVAGNGQAGFGGDGGPADEAMLRRPWGIAFDPNGDLYIADSYNHVIRRVAH